MAGSLANPMNFSWRVIFILMKRIKNLSGKAGVITIDLVLPCKSGVCVFWALFLLT
ncbi:Uncharacterised protein [Enterobacter hormaechei]|nr:Uncharacterised protein [Enterobacter hormaechei]